MGRLGGSSRVLVAAISVAVIGIGAGTARAAAPQNVVFYSGHGRAGFDDARGHSSYLMSESRYTAGDRNCSTSDAIPNSGGRTIRTAAGYSVGRMGAVYYLRESSLARRKALRYVLLYDPGSFGEFQDSCDSRVDVDGILASWLKLDSANRLVVLAGEATLGIKEPGLYNGIRSYYLPKIAAQGLANQALVCNVESNGVPYKHEDVMRVFATLMDDGAPAGCPWGFYGWRPGQRPYANTVVKWNAEPPSPRTAWLVGPDGLRRWIPDGGTYNCLIARLGPVRLLMASVLDKLADQRGQTAACSTGGGAAPPPPPPPPPPPSAPPATYPETTGGAANTWTNYMNAGGTQGPTISAYTTVQIACKVQGFRVADGNTWWYRIAQSPWSNNYYVSADAFYNNGQTSGSLHGTPFVDPAVRDC
jgi:hypothetical protein